MRTAVQQVRRKWSQKLPAHCESSPSRFRRSTLTLTNVDLNDVQGDKKIVEVLKRMGANLTTKERTLTVHPTERLRGIQLDVNDCIDAIPILAVAATFAEGETTLTNGAIARRKECDRIHAMATELKKMGADIEEKEDGLKIRSSKLKGAHLLPHADHRVAMALAVAALGAEGESRIEGMECIAKSYPAFAEAFQSIGAKVTL